MSKRSPPSKPTSAKKPRMDFPDAGERSDGFRILMGIEKDKDSGKKFSELMKGGGCHVELFLDKMNLAAELTAAVVPGQPISSTVKYPLLINMLRNYDNSLKNIAASGRPHSSSLGVFLENMPVRGAVPSEKSHHVVSLAGIRDQLDMQTYSELNERLRADGLEIFDSDIFDRVVDDGKDGSGASGSTSGAGGGVVRERTKAGGSSLIASSAAGATGIVLGLHIVGSEAPDAVKADRVSVIHPPKGTTNAAEKASVDTRQAALDKTHPAADVSHTEAVKELSAAGGEAGQEAGVAEQPSQDKDAPMKAAKAKEAGGGVQQGQAAGPEGEQRSDGDAKKDAGRPVHPDLGSADSTASLPVGEGDGQRRLSDAGQTTEDQGHGRPAAGTGAERRPPTLLHWPRRPGQCAWSLNLWLDELGSWRRPSRRRAAVSDVDLSVH